MRRPLVIRRRPVPRNCHFCQTKTEPDYKEPGSLMRFITERGKILSHSQTGVCSKHQRGIAQAVKRARQVALLPFVVRA